MATIARSYSSVNLLQNSYVSIMALAVAALWTVLRQVLRSLSIVLVEAVRLAQLVGLPLQSIAKARRAADGQPRCLITGLPPQYRQRPPFQWQLQQQQPQQQQGNVRQSLPQPAVLPPPARVGPSAARGRLTVVLDLDETLVCTWQADGLAAAHRVKAPPPATGAFIVNCELSAGTCGRLTVLPRPGLAEFLHRASGVADLMVFTAGQPGYAKPILDVLDPTGTLFTARLYRDSTVKTMHHENVKDLSRLRRDLARTVLVDNSPFSFLLQPSNGLPVRPFVGHPSDTELLTVVLPILEGLAACAGDIRPVLAHQFRMAAWLQRRLQPQ